MIRRRDLPPLLAPLLAGCRSSGGGPIRIALAQGLLEVFAAHLAKRLGHFEDEGLDVTLDELVGSRQTESLLAGSSDAVYSSFSTILYLAAEERAARSIFLGLEALSAMLVVSGEKASRFQRVSDLKGATVGVSSFGSPQHQILSIMLSQHGLTLEDVNVIAYGSGPSAVAALQYNRVDAGTINGSAFSVLKRRAPGVRILVDPRTREGTKALTGAETYPNYCLIATPQWLDRNPDSAVRLTRAMLRTVRWIHSHGPEDARAQLPPGLRGEDVEADIESLRILIANTSRDGHMPPEGPPAVLRFIAGANAKVRNTTVELGSTYTNQFVAEAGSAREIKP